MEAVFLLPNYPETCKKFWPPVRSSHRDLIADVQASLRRWNDDALAKAVGLFPVGFHCAIL